MDTHKQNSPPPLLARSYWSAGLAGLLALEIIGLGIYSYVRIQYALDPNRLADRVETAVRENYPEFRQELIATVHQKSPEFAQQVSTELLSSAPDARESLEQLTARQLDRGLEEVTELSAEHFRQMLKDNREQIVQVFEKIEDAPEEAHQLVLDTEKNLEREFGVDVQQQARQALRTHRQLNDKLAKLADRNAALSSQELLERRIVRLLRSLQVHGASDRHVMLKPTQP